MVGGWCHGIGLYLFSRDWSLFDCYQWSGSVYLHLYYIFLNMLGGGSGDLGMGVLGRGFKAC